MLPLDVVCSVCSQGVGCRRCVYSGAVSVGEEPCCTNGISLGSLCSPRELSGEVVMHTSPRILDNRPDVVGQGKRISSVALMMTVQMLLKGHAVAMFGNGNSMCAVGLIV